MIVTVEALQAENVALQQRVADLEAALAEARQDAERLHMIVHTVIDWAWEVDANGVYTYVSSNVGSVLGYTPDEIVGKTPFDLMPPDEAARVGAIFGAIAAAQEPIQLLENAVLHKDGRRLVMETNGTPFSTQDGAFAGYRGVDRDMTERKQAELERDQLFTLSPDLICIAGFDGYFQRLNASWSRVLGWTADELRAVPFLDFVHPDDRQATLDAAQNLAAGQTIIAFTNRYRCKDGSYRWIEWVSAPVTAQQHIYAVARDVTERKQTEAELRIFKTIVEQSPEAIGYTDMQGTIVYINHTHQEIFGYPEAEIIGAPVHTLVPLTERLQKGMDVVADGAVWQGESVNQRRDGSHFPVDVTVFSVAGTGAERYIVAITRDITERKQQEDELRMFQSLVEHAPDSIAVGGVDGTIVYVNQTFRTKMGYGDAIIGMPIVSLIAEEWRAHLPGILQQTYEQGSWQGVIEHLREDGVGIPTDVSIGLITATDGTPRGVGAVIRDITEKVQRERELEIFKLMAEHAPDALGMATPDGTMIYANPAYRTLTGYGADLIGMNFLDLFADADRPLALEALQETGTAGTWQGILTFQRADGRRVPIDARGFAIRDQQGTPIILVGLFRDITERRQQENELRKFKTLVEIAPSMISIAGTDGHYEYLNPAFRERLAIPADRPANTITLADIAPAENLEETINLVGAHIATHGFWRGRLPFQSWTGRIFPGDLLIFALRTSTGEPEQFIAIATDVSDQVAAEAEREALQQQIIDAQRDALRELSTPLIPITERVVIMPLIGTIDSGRAQMIMETLLDGVARYQAELVILDITGVAIVDTQVAQVFLQAAQAVRLLGAQVMLTGIQPPIAQTLVHLGVDMSGLQTRGSLQAGIAAALRRGG